MPGENNDNDYQLINRFFEGELSAEEEKAVDERIQADRSFAEKMAGFVALHRSAHELRREELEAMYPPPSPATGRLPTWLLWAGLALTLAAGLYFLISYGPTPSASPPGQPVALQSGEAALDYIRQRDAGFFDELGGDWKADFRAGDYAAARQKLNAELDESDNLSNQGRACYYAGLLNLFPEEGPPNLSRAITCLEAGRPEKEDAVLYLLIAYVKAGQPEKARALAAELPAAQVRRLPPEIRQAL